MKTKQQGRARLRAYRCTSSHCDGVTFVEGRPMTLPHCANCGEKLDPEQRVRHLDQPG